MNRMRLVAALAACLIVSPAFAQPPAPKPGPEFDGFKKLVGDWDMTMKMDGGEAKGTANFRMDLGGMWCVQNVEMDMGGMKFTGRGMDSYDANKKKYVGVWFDSMTTSPLVMEGTFDAATKTMTMAGEGPGMDGKIIKHTCKTTWVDDNTFTFSMTHGDAKDAAVTITYKRKK